MQQPPRSLLQWKFGWEGGEVCICFSSSQRLVCFFNYWVLFLFFTSLFWRPWNGKKMLHPTHTIFQCKSGWERDEVCICFPFSQRLAFFSFTEKCFHFLQVFFSHGGWGWKFILHPPLSLFQYKSGWEGCEVPICFPFSQRLVFLVYWVLFSFLKSL